MNKKMIAQGFAARLHQVLTQAGFTSARSKSGVSIAALIELCGHSRQMCRKYLLGEAIPEPAMIAHLACRLEVSPGWLLFGDLQELQQQDSCLQISKSVLDYILQHPILYRIEPEYLLNLLERISGLHFNDHQMKKVIDISFAGFRPSSVAKPELHTS